MRVRATQHLYELLPLLDSSDMGFVSAALQIEFASVQTRIQPRSRRSVTRRPRDWIRIASMIEREFWNYDGACHTCHHVAMPRATTPRCRCRHNTLTTLVAAGFVVVMGTDTMAYCASALSFLCENLNKTIVLTGAMLPLVDLFNDAHRNLIVSLVRPAQRTPHRRNAASPLWPAPRAGR